MLSSPSLDHIIEQVLCKFPGSRTVYKVTTCDCCNQHTYGQDAVGINPDGTTFHTALTRTEIRAEGIPLTWEETRKFNKKVKAWHEAA